MTQMIQNQNEKTTDLYEDYDDDLDYIFGGSRNQNQQNQNQQNQNQQEQQNQQRKNTNNNNNTSSTISIIPHGAGSVRRKSENDQFRPTMSYEEFMARRAEQCKPYEPTQQDYSLIREAYTDNVGQMTSVVARMIEQAMGAGMTAEEVVMAIEETGMAPHPSPWYLRAVLRTWAETGFTHSRVRGKFYGNDATKWWK